VNLSTQMGFREEVFPSDLETVRDLTASTGFFSKEEIAVATELVEERLAKGLRSGYHFLFAEYRGQVAGYTCFGPVACTLASYDVFWIAVSNDLRGRGIGKSLLEKTEQKIAALGGERIYVETSARDLYRATHAFYQRSGYDREAVLRDFYAPGDDKIVYLKILRPPASTGGA